MSTLATTTASVRPDTSMAHHLKRFPEALAALTQLLSEGKLHYREQIFDDLEQASAALLSLFDGSSFGKVLVRL